MLKDSKILAIIPARGGSKGVPGKNTRFVAGKPLIAWTIEAAHGSSFIDRTILSSDDQEIIDISKTYNCEAPYKRSAHLASDTAPMIDVVLDAIDNCPGYDFIVLLQPTSPLRTSYDIDQTLMKCVKYEASSCVSVSAAQESPYWMFTLGHAGRLQPLFPDSKLSRRQDLPAAYSLNGAIYVANTKWLQREKQFINKETISYEMPNERSVDIDTESDFIQLKILLEAQKYA